MLLCQSVLKYHVNWRQISAFCTQKVENVVYNAEILGNYLGIKEFLENSLMFMSSQSILYFSLQTGGWILITSERMCLIFSWLLFPMCQSACASVFIPMHVHTYYWNVMEVLLYYSDYTDYFVMQASVVWAREGERKERSYEAFTQVQLCDPTHVHGGHQAARGKHRCTPQTKRRTRVTAMGHSSESYIFCTISSWLWSPRCRCSTYVVAWSSRYEKWIIKMHLLLGSYPLKIEFKSAHNFLSYFSKQLFILCARECVLVLPTVSFKLKDISEFI